MYPNDVIYDHQELYDTIQNFVYGGEGSIVKFGGPEHLKFCLTSVGSEFEAGEYYNISLHIWTRVR